MGNWETHPHIGERFMCHISLPEDSQSKRVRVKQLNMLKLMIRNSGGLNTDLPWAEQKGNSVVSHVSPRSASLTCLVCDLLFAKDLFSFSDPVDIQLLGFL